VIDGPRSDNVWILAARYTSLRVVLFAIPFLLLLLTPLDKIVDVAIGIVVSSIASLLLGRELRVRMEDAWRQRQAAR